MLKHLTNDDAEPKPNQDAIVLYVFQFCPFSRRVMLTISHHKIAHERVYVDINKKPSWFLTLNPTGKVPIIEQSGQKMVDSEMICRFLDQLSCDSLLSESGENSVKMVNDWFAKAFKSFHAVAFETSFTKDQETIYIESLNDFESFPGSLFIGGDNVGLADYMIYPVMELVDICLIRLGRQTIKESGQYTRINLWLKAMDTCEAVQKEKIPAHVHSEYIASLLNIPGSL